MSKMLTDQQTIKLAKMPIVMNVPKDYRLEILTAIETQEELLLFLDKLSAKNYEVTPDEIYEAMLSTIEEMTLREFYEGGNVRARQNRQIESNNNHQWFHSKST